MYIYMYIYIYIQGVAQRAFVAFAQHTSRSLLTLVGLISNTHYRCCSTGFCGIRARRFRGAWW